MPQFSEEGPPGLPRTAPFGAPAPLHATEFESLLDQIRFLQDRLAEVHARGMATFRDVPPPSRPRPPLCGCPASMDKRKTLFSLDGADIAERTHQQAEAAAELAHALDTVKSAVNASMEDSSREPEPQHLQRTFSIDSSGSEVPTFVPRGSRRQKDRLREGGEVEHFSSGSEVPNFEPRLSRRQKDSDIRYRRSPRRALDTIVMPSGSTEGAPDAAHEKGKGPGFRRVSSRETQAPEEDRRVIRRWWPVVESSLGAIIVLNVALMGISCDVHPLWLGWVIVDGVFGVIFASEIALKNWAFGARAFLCGPERWWHLFEVALVVLAFVDLIMSCLRVADPSHRVVDDNDMLFPLFRMVRLMRIARIGRLSRLSLFQDMSVLIRSTSGALLWAFFLLGLPLFAAALFFREAFGGPGQDSFGSVPASFFTLFRCIVAGDCNEATGKPIFLLVTQDHGWGFGALYLIIVFLVSLGLFNVIAAIFIEQVVVGAKTNAQLVKRQRLRDQALYSNKIGALVSFIVRAGEAYERRCRTSQWSWDSTLSLEETLRRGMELHITPDFFSYLAKQATFADLLTDLDVGTDDQLEMFDMLDVDGSGIVDLEELVEGISKLRGDAKRSDIIAIDFQLKALTHACEQNFANLQSMIQAQETPRDEVHGPKISVWGLGPRFQI